MPTRVLTLSLLAVVPAVAMAVEPPPLVIHHQGRLLGPGDAPVTGSRDLLVRIWDGEHSEAVVWSETFAARFDDQGSYALALGETKGGRKALTAEDVAGERWFSVTVDDVELLPRQRLGGTAIAAWALNASEATNAAALGGSPAASWAEKAWVDAAIEALSIETVARVSGKPSGRPTDTWSSPCSSPAAPRRDAARLRRRTSTRESTSRSSTPRGSCRERRGLSRFRTAAARRWGRRSAGGRPTRSRTTDT